MSGKDSDKDDGPKIFIAVYRPNPGKDDEFRALLKGTRATAEAAWADYRAPDDHYAGGGWLLH